MGLSVANILLEVTGESADAKRELADVARELALFSREEAEAAAYVDGSEAQRELDELKVALERIDAKSVSAEVNVRIAKAQADLTALQAELKKIDGEDVEVDIDVKRGIAEKFGALSGQISRLGKDTEAVSSGGLRDFISSIAESASGTSIFGVSLRAVALAAPLLITVLVAVVGQLVAVVASALSAAGGLAALAVAFGATLVPGILLAVGALAQFADQADTAGTAAHSLKLAFGDFGEAFKSATAGGADALFRGLADALRDMQPVVSSLGPAFTRLGQAGGDALRTLGEHFSSPAWRQFFGFVTDSLARLSPLLARSFGAFADILRNIATAAMPFLIDGLRSVAQFLENIADRTSDIGALREVIGGMVDSLGAWMDLLGGATDLVGAFVAAFSPFGDGIVESLAEGAHALADWLRSEDGLEDLSDFFEKTGPLAAELGKWILNVGLALVQLAELIAPVVTPILAAFNNLFGVLNKGLAWLNDQLSASTLQDLGKILLLAFSPITFLAENFGKLKSAVSNAFDAIKSTGVGAFNGVRDAAAGAFDWIKGAAPNAFEAVFAALTAPIRFQIDFAQNIAERARGIWGTVKGVISDVIKFVINFADGIAARARNVWSSVKGVITDVIRFILNFPDGVAGRARSLWGTVKGVITDGISFVLSLPGEIAGRARDLWGNVKGVISDAIQFVINLPGVGSLVSAARAIWDAINSALPDIEINIHIPTPSVPDIPGLAVGVQDLPFAGLHRVGEEGEELAFLPQGADVYTASETKRILRALAKGIASPLGGVGGGSPVAVAGAGGGNTYNLQVVSPGTGSPDPDIAVAKLAAVLRARGGVPNQ